MLKNGHKPTLRGLFYGTYHGRMIPPWVLIDVHLKHIKMFIADLVQESLERSQRTPGLTLFK